MIEVVIHSIQPAEQKKLDGKTVNMVRRKYETESLRERFISFMIFTMLFVTVVNEECISARLILNMTLKIEEYCNIYLAVSINNSILNTEDQNIKRLQEV